MMIRPFCARVMPMRRFAGTKLDRRQKDLLISEVAALLLGKEPVLFAYLYGSFLGDGPFRDMDVGVYLDFHSFKNPEEMFQYSLALGAECDLAFSGVTIDLRPLNLAPLPFQFEVVTRGQVLFAKDEERQIEFEVRIRSLYFDFVPHLKLHYKRIVLGE